MSLAEAVTRAKQRHLEIRAADARIESAQGRRIQASLPRDPRLFLQSENNRLWGAPGFSYPRGADTFAYASHIIEAGGKRLKREHYYNENVRRTEIERDLTAYQRAYRVHRAYWTALGDARKSDVLHQALANFDAIVQYHRDRVREGAMAEADLLRVEVEHERLRISVKSAEQDAARARAELFREIGVPYTASVILTERLEELQAIPGADIDAALRDRIDLQLARQAKVEAEANVTLQKANAKPDPEVLAGYKRTAGFDTLIAGVQINLPFRNRNQGMIASAVADVKVADASLRAATISAETELSAARATFESRSLLITETFPPLRAKAIEVARIAEGAYREGGADLLRLLDAQRARIETELLYYGALLDYHFATVELKAALGIL